MTSVSQLANIFKKNYFIIFLIIEIIAFIITFELVSIFVDPLQIFYLVFVSILFTSLINLVIYETRINILELNIKTAVILFFLVYIFLSVWYGLIKAYPEYKDIMVFRKKRVDLIYNIQKNAPPLESLLAYKRQLAELYLHADPSVDRLEPHVNRQGVSLMIVFLEEQIRNGKGREYRKSMYDLAEVAFTVASRDLAHQWYQNAYKYGVSNALERYNERMKEFR